MSLFNDKLQGFKEYDNCFYESLQGFKEQVSLLDDSLQGVKDLALLLLTVARVLRLLLRLC